jgi:hypothetical protein
MIREREAGMRLVPTAGARRYLYELLTGCALVTAPPPYRLSAGSLDSYNDFALGIPASVATALAGHARHLLDGWGIGCEPLQWQPPGDWVTATAWPGVDPAAPTATPCCAAWRGGSPCLRERVAGVSFVVVVPAASGSAGRASSSPVAHGNDSQGWFLWSFPPDAADPRA